MVFVECFSCSLSSQKVTTSGQIDAWYRPNVFSQSHIVIGKRVLPAPPLGNAKATRFK